MALAVVLGVLGMHQLLHPAPLGQSMSAEQSMSKDLSMPVGQPVSLDLSLLGRSAAVGHHRNGLSAETVEAMQPAAPLTAPGAAPQQHDPGSAGCSLCGGHSTLVALCILTLSLLVLTWRLPARSLRSAPPVGRCASPSVTLVFRRLPPLSLIELSVCRT